MNRVWPYIAHLRLRGFVPSFLFSFTGFFASPTLHTNNLLASIISGIALFFSFSVCLFGGGCAFNTFKDGDDDRPLNFLNKPPKIPKHLGIFSVMMMILGVLISFIMDWRAGFFSAIFFVLLIFYSANIPFLKRRGKDIGILDNLINAIGCGILAVLIGYCYSGAVIDNRILLIGTIFTLTVFASYPASQIFQLKSTDTYVTAKNYTSLIGARESLLLSIPIFLLALGLMSLTHGFGLDASHLALYLGFYALILAVIVLFYRWSYKPFHFSKEKANTTWKLLLFARILWIIAQLKS